MHTATYTYTIADVEATFRRFRSDIFMIADSTKAITREQAEDYAHDAEHLAKRGYLAYADVTLLSGAIEHKAARYTVNEEAGDLESARPGGVLWPKVDSPRLRVVLSYTKKYTSAAREETRPYLKISWVPCTEDTSHSGLKATGGRDYSSNGYALHRKDFAQ